jgi:hypothetical protein
MDWMFGFIALIHSARNYKQYSATANLFTLHFTAAHTSVLSSLQSPLSVSWQMILTQGLYQSH